MADTPEHPSWPSICAVVVTYHPDRGAAARLSAIGNQSSRLIIVDNGSSPDTIISLQSRLPSAEFLLQHRNIGLACALNEGLRRARFYHHDWAVIFDQDSCPSEGMVDAMWATHLRFPEAAVVAPRISEPSASEKSYRWVRRSRRLYGFLFERVSCLDQDLPSVTHAITSGSLVDLNVWNDLGQFEGKLFIDYIDVEYCLRARRAGRTIAVSAGAILDHRLGNRKRIMLLGRDLRPTFHEPFRHYYISRNRVLLWRRYAMSEPHWAVFDLCFAIYNLARVVCLEDRKWKKVMASIRGLIDGLRGVFGQGPSFQ